MDGKPKVKNDQLLRRKYNMKKLHYPFFVNHNMVTHVSSLISSDDLALTVGYNVGNSYISYGLMKNLYGGLIKADGFPSFLDLDFSQNKSIENTIGAINELNQPVIIFFQDHIRRDYSSWKKIDPRLIDFIKKLRVDICVLSLGANAFSQSDACDDLILDSDLERLLRVLSDRVHTLGVRGEFTAEILRKFNISNVDVVGCPSWYEMGRNRRLFKNPTSSPKIVLSSPYHVDLGQISKNYPILLQDEWEIIKSEYYSDDKIPSYVNHDVRFFTSIENLKLYLSQFDFSFGTRVHGAIAAINAGVPAVITNGDYRSREMAELFGIPYYPGRGAEGLEELYQSYDCSLINKKYDFLYENFMKFLSNNGISPSRENNGVMSQPDFQKNFEMLEISQKSDIKFIFYLPYYTQSSYGISLIWQLALEASRIFPVEIRVFNRGESSPPTILPGTEALILKNKDYANAYGAIVIYPDIVEDNPLNANLVARFMLGNRLILEGGPIKFGKNDFIFSYSHAVSTRTPQLNFHSDSLFELANLEISSSNSHILFYYGKCRIHKYDKKSLRKIIKQLNLPIRIVTRGYPSERAELFSLVKNAAVVICFDSLSNFAYEATLLGTPVIFVDEAFKSRYNSYNHRLHGFYYLSEKPSIRLDDTYSSELARITLEELFRIQKNHKKNIRKIFNSIIKHHANGLENKEIIQNYLSEEENFYVNEWASAKFINCYSFRHVVLYHLVNASAAVRLAVILPFSIIWLGIFFARLFNVIANVLFKSGVRVGERLNLYKIYLEMIMGFGHKNKIKQVSMSGCMREKVKTIIVRILSAY